MKPPIEIDSWKRQGHSILWDAACLASFCDPSQPVSLRQFLQLHASGWKGVDDRLVKERALVVAGLEGAIDALHPSLATDWMEQNVYPAVLSFQKAVAYGGGEAALIFWFAESRRFSYRQAEQAAYWECGKAHGNFELRIGRCLWNGSEPNGQEIRLTADKQASRLVGYYLNRIS
jgi:hypothetical protein